MQATHSVALHVRRLQVPRLPLSLVSAVRADMVSVQYTAPLQQRVYFKQSHTLFM